jgi:hypothetical protein
VEAAKASSVIRGGVGATVQHRRLLEEVASVANLAQAAQTRRTKEVRIQHNTNSLSRNSVSRKPATLVKASHCHFHHGEADPDAQVRLMMARDCKEHEESE